MAYIASLCLKKKKESDLQCTLKKLELWGKAAIKS